MNRDPVVDRLLRELWSRDVDYYARARETVRQAASAGAEYRLLDGYLPAAGRLLEVGCGEGSNLEALAGRGRTTFGCDLSPLAARLADPIAPGRVVVAEGERLPFASASFDGVVAISVIEHLSRPEVALAEMIRVLARDGVLAVLSPQYGGPLGASPNRAGGGAARFLRRWLGAHRASSARSALGWERVHPKVLDHGVYQGDLDALCEPEIRSLRAFLTASGLRVIASTSGYEWHSWREWKGTPGQRVIRGIFERLGRAGIPPYRDFGPMILVAAKRTDS
ncbi:MAG TPA: class I SAM-dependent methyltransferase [Candidatus Polarisedimenticolaceae bacterium]